MQSFTGELTDEIRNSFLDKRNSLKLTRYKLAQLLGIDPVTIKRWEEGPTTQTSQIMISIITDFIEGKFDRKIMKQTVKPSLPGAIRSIPREIISPLVKLSKLYMSCSSQPQLRERILQGLKQIASEANNETVPSE